MVSITQAISFKRFTVCQRRTKNAYIGEGTVSYYESWHNKYWKAFRVTSAEGAILVYDYAACDEDYNNDRKITEHAYNAYMAPH